MFFFKKKDYNSDNRRRIIPPAENYTQQRSVYIGLDFGTTFTKASYEVSPSPAHTKYSVKFGNTGTPDDYYTPSILFYDKSSCELRLTDNNGEYIPIRYFKYSMISDALEISKELKDTDIVTSAPKEQLCCVFYLSYVITLIKNDVINRFGSDVINAETKWYINMGIPVEAQRNNTKVALYLDALNVACLLANNGYTNKKISIYTLDSFFATNKDSENRNNNVLPEIYAEVLLFQQHMNTPQGFYTVVDIGGGTADIATFLKTTQEHERAVDCLEQKVIPFGYNSLSDKISCQPSYRDSYAIRNYLARRDVMFNMGYDEFLNTLPEEIDIGSLLAARDECRGFFGKCVQSARRKMPDVLEKTVELGIPMYLFVMGGASNVQFYQTTISYMIDAQKNAGIPYIKKADITDYVSRSTNLDVRNDQRLLISQMLAQPYEMIPEIMHMPWDLNEKPSKLRVISDEEREARYKELYRD